VAILGGGVLWAWFDPGGFLLGDREASSAISGSSNGRAGIQQTLETIEGISIRVNSVGYGVENPESLLISEPLGEFVTVTFLVANDSSDTLRFSSSRISATIAGAEYEPSGLASPEGEYLGFSERINPGLSQTIVAYFDIPPGSILDTFKYDPPGFGDDSLLFGLGG
jgi:hypothetical protein